MKTWWSGVHDRFPLAIIGAWVMAAVVSCSRPAQPVGYPPARAGDEYTVMTYHLGRFAYADRDGDGQENEFKPESEIAAIIEIVSKARPDILVAQGLGDASTLPLLQRRLKEAGVDFPHTHHLPNVTGKDTLGVLSRYPLTAPTPITNLTYTIKDQTHFVQRGFQQVDAIVSSVHTVRIINVHLPAKVFSESGHTEMRRNEARLLATHVRRLLRENPHQHLLVCGDFSDSEPSAAMRELIGPPAAVLLNLPLTDVYGDAWTHHARNDDVYSRTDYMLVNAALRPLWQPEKSGIIRDQLTRIASEHRPLIATFKAAN